MGWIDDIAEKMKSMKDKNLHEEFSAITQRLVDTDSMDLLSSMYRIICEYDRVSRLNFGLMETNKNLNKKLYNKQNDYTGGFSKRRKEHN